MSRFTLVSITKGGWRMDSIKIFIASSSEVEEERIALEKYINELSNQYYEFDLHLQPIMWESESKEFNKARKQDEYNKKLITSDVVVFMFGSRVGFYTKEEFDLAVKNQREGKYPKHIFAYFKNVLLETYKLNKNHLQNLDGILILKEHIENTLNQVHTSFFNKVDLQLKVGDELNRIFRRIIFNRSKESIEDEKIQRFINLYARTERPHEVSSKNNIVESAILDLYMLSNFNYRFEQRELSEEEFYRYCRIILGTVNNGSEIKALSMMLKCEWTNTVYEQEFWQANIKAVKQGVLLTRIFIVKKNEAHRLKNTPQILNHVECADDYLVSYIVEEEVLKARAPDLLSRANNGFLLIKDSGFKIALLDGDPNSEVRGIPRINENELYDLEDLFNRIKAHAIPLKEYLKAIPLSHCKKEMLSVFVTTKCNLNCDYCFTNKNTGTHKSQTIDFEFVKSGIDDYFTTNYLRHIRFFGAGEPTMEFNLIRDICQYAKDIGGESVTFEIQTNGAFSATVAKWLAKNIHIIWISCDGIPDIQNAHRPFLNDTRKTSDVIERNIRDIKREGEGFCIAGIRATITNENIDRQVEMIDYFCSLDINYIWVDPIFPSVDEKPSGNNNKFDIMQFAHKFLEACEYAESKNVFYGSILTCNFADNVTRHCRACIPTPHLTSDGFISACDMALFGKDKNHMNPFIYGKWNDVEKRIIYDEDKKKILQSRNTDNEKLSHCSTCQSREHCGGYCLGEVLNETGSLFGQKEKVCEAIRFLDSQMTPAQRIYLYTHP